MSTNATDWLAVAVFTAMLLPVVVAESLWLVLRGWTTIGRAIAFSLATSGLGVALSGVIIFAAVLVMFMLVMGPAGEGSDTGDAAYILIVLFALILIFVVVAGIKMLFLRLLKMQSGRTAFLYSAVIAIALIISVLVVPIAVIYLRS